MNPMQLRQSRGMNRAHVAFAFALGGLINTGCAARESGFPAVGNIVSERLGTPTRWSRRSTRSDDGATSGEAHEMLARPLVAATAVRIALANNRDLRAVLEELGISSAALLSASLLPNPSVGFSYQFPLGSGDPGRPGLIDADAMIDVRAMILLPTLRAAASAAFEAARLQAAARAIDLAFDTQVAWFDFIAAAQLVDLWRTVLQATGASFETARVLRESGNIPPYDLTQQEALYQESRLALVSAENDVQQQRERLNVVLGVWGNDANWRAEPRLPEPPAGELPIADFERRAIERSLPLAAMRRTIEAARRRVTQAQAMGAVPQIEAGVAAAQHEGVNYTGPAVRVTLPLLNQGQGGISMRNAELRRDEARLVAIAVRVRADSRAAHAQLAFAHQRVDFFRSVLLPVRQRAVEQAMQQYNAMQIPIFQLLQTRRDQIKTGRDYIGALREYWTARAGLDRLLAGGSPRMNERNESEDTSLSMANGGDAMDR